jgi:hypothetical protein
MVEGDYPAMTELRRSVERAASAPFAALIDGEAGQQPRHVTGDFGDARDLRAVESRQRGGESLS